MREFRTNGKRGILTNWKGLREYAEAQGATLNEKKLRNDSRVVIDEEDYVIIPLG